MSFPHLPPNPNTFNPPGLPGWLTGEDPRALQDALAAADLDAATSADLSLAMEGFSAALQAMEEGSQEALRAFAFMEHHGFIKAGALANPTPVSNGQFYGQMNGGPGLGYLVAEGTGHWGRINPSADGPTLEKGMSFFKDQRTPYFVGYTQGVEWAGLHNMDGDWSLKRGMAGADGRLVSGLSHHLQYPEAPYFAFVQRGTGPKNGVWFTPDGKVQTEGPAGHNNS